MSTDSRPSITGLLQLARSGDRQALDRLFAACRSYALILAQAQVGSWIQAKLDPSDLVQQSMLEAYRAFDSFQGETSAEWLAWLRRILQRNAVDQARYFGGTEKRKVGKEVSLAGAPTTGNASEMPEPAANSPTPSEQLLIRERELLVAEALTRLSPEYREVILLRNLQGLSFQEVARQMNRSRPAVQMLWMRALRKLQALLEETACGSSARP
jgi:RNA polymerase sigma-70 factor, ECF subfamily